MTEKQEFRLCRIMEDHAKRACPSCYQYWREISRLEAENVSLKEQLVGDQSHASCGIFEDRQKKEIESLKKSGEESAYDNNVLILNMENKIESLKAENAELKRKLKGFEDGCFIYAHRQEVESLKAERDKYREALKGLDHPLPVGPISQIEYAINARLVAKDALSDTGGGK